MLDSESLSLELAHMAVEPSIEHPRRLGGKVKSLGDLGVKFGVGLG